MTGDSMSRSLIPLASKFHNNDNFDFISFYRSSTLSPPIPYAFRKQNLKSTSKKIKDQEFYLQNIIEYVDKEEYKNKFIWIFNDMNLYFYGREWQKDALYFIDENKKRIKHAQAFDDWLFSLKRLINKANEKDIKVLFFGSLPSIQNGYEVICQKYSESKSNEINKLCKDNVIRRCSDLLNCPIYEKGEMYLSDSVHLSPSKAIDLYPLVKSKMKFLEIN